MFLADEVPLPGHCARLSTLLMGVPQLSRRRHLLVKDSLYMAEHVLRTQYRRGARSAEYIRQGRLDQRSAQPAALVGNHRGRLKLDLGLSGPPAL